MHARPCVSVWNRVWFRIVPPIQSIYVKCIIESCVYCYSLVGGRRRRRCMQHHVASLLVHFNPESKYQYFLWLSLALRCPLGVSMFVLRLYILVFGQHTRSIWRFAARARVNWTHFVYFFFLSVERRDLRDPRYIYKFNRLLNLGVFVSLCALRWLTHIHVCGGWPKWRRSESEKKKTQCWHFNINLLTASNSVFCLFACRWFCRFLFIAHRHIIGQQSARWLSAFCIACVCVWKWTTSA